MTHFETLARRDLREDRDVREDMGAESELGAGLPQWTGARLVRTIKPRKIEQASPSHDVLK